MSIHYELYEQDIVTYATGKLHKRIERSQHAVEMLEALDNLITRLSGLDREAVLWLLGTDVLPAIDARNRPDPSPWNL